MKFALVMLSHDIESALSATKALIKQKGLTMEVCLRTVEELTNPERLDEFVQFAKTSNIVLMHLMGGKKNFSGFDRIITTLSEMHVPFFGSDVQSDREVVSPSTVNQTDYQTIYQYIKCGGVENYENLFLFLANRFTGADFDVKPPKPLPLQGIYHPKLGHVLTLSEYIERQYVPGRPTVGILFHSDPLKTGDVSFANSFIESIERHEANAIMVFFSNDPAAKNLKQVIEDYFMEDGKTVVDVVVSMAAHSVVAFLPGSESANSVFKMLGVPILKAISTYNTYETWRDSPLGLDYTEVAWNVAMPEFDGMIITVPIAARWISETDPLTGTKITSHKVIPERLNKLVRLSINWAKLRHIPNDQRRVAVIFHNYPPKNDSIGSAAGLDTAASAINLLREMQKQGQLPQEHRRWQICSCVSEMSAKNR